VKGTKVATYEEARRNAPPGDPIHLLNFSTALSPLLNRKEIALLYPPARYAYIYTLSDPRTGQVRYVGKTLYITGRFNHHLKRATPTTHKGCWILGLRKLGLEPEIDVVDFIPANDTAAFWAAEQFWIETFRAMGCKLTNLMEGGRGGARMSDESRAKASASAKAKWAAMTPEQLKEWGAKFKGRKASEETKEKMRAARAAVPDSARQSIKRAHAEMSPEKKAEWKAKISSSLKGRPQTQELILKRTSYLNGRKLPEATKEKIRAKALARGKVNRA
jgi:hypothetical protein